MLQRKNKTIYLNDIFHWLKNQNYMCTWKIIFLECLIKSIDKTPWGVYFWNRGLSHSCLHRAVLASGITSGHLSLTNVTKNHRRFQNEKNTYFVTQRNIRFKQKIKLIKGNVAFQFIQEEFRCGICRWNSRVLRIFRSFPRKMQQQ